MRFRRSLAQTRWAERWERQHVEQGGTAGMSLACKYGNFKAALGLPRTGIHEALWMS